MERMANERPRRVQRQGHSSGGNAQAQTFGDMAKGVYYLLRIVQILAGDSE